MELPRLIASRYEIIRLIAEGGMGNVYEARHTVSHRTVALKVLKRTVGQSDAADQRFLREVRAPAQIGHEGIVQVFDAGVDETAGMRFVAMELLQGETLGARLKRGKLGEDQVLNLFEALLVPLAAAHDKGFVHRDMKPDNVFIVQMKDGSEKLKLLDFGIAREIESTQVTQTGTTMGTPDYMSPEQATDAGSATAATDIWAVGVMLYQGLAGEMPFRGKTPSAVIVDALTRPHVSLVTVRPTVAPALSALLDRCLAKDAAQRFANAGELLQALAAARGKNAQAGTPGIPRPGGPFDAARAPLADPAPTSSSTGPFDAAPPTNEAPGSSWVSGPMAAYPPRPGGPPPGAPFGAPPSTGGPFTGAAGARSFAAAPAKPKSGCSVYVLGALVGGLVVLGGAAAAGIYFFSEAWEDGSVGAQPNANARVMPGELRPGDRQLETGEFIDFFEFHWPMGAEVHLECRSTAFDTYLVVRSPSGRQKDNDDPRRGVTDAALDLTTQEGGRFRVGVTTYEPGESGPYQLIVDVR